MNPTHSTGQPYRQLWQVPAFFLGLAALVGVCIARPTWREGDLRQLARDEERARQVLDQHRTAPSEALPLAERLAEQAVRHPDQAGDLEFLAGSLYVRIAERDLAAAALDAWTKARVHLEEAQTLGVGANDFPRLTYLLAKVWFHTDGDMADVVEFLERSIDDGADQPAEGYALLADAYLRLPTRDVEGALRANEKELDLGYVNEELLAPARLLRGELLLELKRNEEARKVLANIGTQAPPAVLAKARYLRALSLQEEGHWNQAEEVWREALDDKSVPPREPARMFYYLGVCYRELKQPADAARAWLQCAQRGDAGDAGPAAAIQLAELQLADADPTPALETLDSAVRDVKSSADWHNSLIAVDRVREVLQAGCERFRTAGRFEQAIRVATLYQPLALEGRAELQAGRAAYEWGQRLQSTQADEARGRFRQAGEAFAKASQATTAPAERVERLWQAMECFAAANEPARTVQTVEAMLTLVRDWRVPLEPQRYGEALFRRAEAHRALGQESLALYYFGECINYRSPYAYRARYYQAMAKAEEKKIDEARNILDQNLSLLRSEDNPDREAYEKTLYALGRLLYESRDFSAAARAYEQALEKFRANPDAVPALYQLADCYRELAEQEAKASEPGDRMLPATREHHHQEARKYWQSAVKRYQEIADALDKQQREKSLDKDAEGLRWRVHMHIAECYYKGEQVANARAEYEKLSGAYEGKAEELYVLRGLANCYWSSDAAGNKALALQTVEKMRALLSKLSDAQLDLGAGSWDRVTWQAWLIKVSTPLKSK